MVRMSTKASSPSCIPSSPGHEITSGGPIDLAVVAAE